MADDGQDFDPGLVKVSGAVLRETKRIAAHGNPVNLPARAQLLRATLK